MDRKRKSTEAQIAGVVYMGNVTNDAEILRQKKIKSPTMDEMYAVAYSKDGRTQRWFRDKAALERFLETAEGVEYQIRRYSMK